MDVTLKGGNGYGSDPIKIDLGDLNIRTTHEGNYEAIKLDITGSNLLCSLDVQKPKIETLTDLLHNLLQFRESDLAKLTLVDRGTEITNIIDTVINKIQMELMNY